MTVTVKYCGGCNPDFDRMAIVKQLLLDFPETALAAAGESSDLALVICGCRTRCAAHKDLQGLRGKFILCAPEDYARLKEWFVDLTFQ